LPETLITVDPTTRTQYERPMSSFRKMPALDFDVTLPLYATVQRGRTCGQELCPACGRGHLILIDCVPPTRRSSITPDTS
jgi:hypothetical protein